MTEASNGKPPQPRNPRMIDVAKLADVSHQTVSRVLNASPSVGPELTQRVHQAIQMLGYKRNSAARALASRRSMTFGVVSFGITLFGTLADPIRLCRGGPPGRLYNEPGHAGGL